MSEYNPYNEKETAEQKKKRKEQEEFERAIEQSDFRKLMSTKWGRSLVWRILGYSGVFSLSFSTNAMTMAFNEGNRNFGQHMLIRLHKYCPDEYHLMMKENRVNGTSNSNDNG